MSDMIMRDENGKPLPKSERKALRKANLMAMENDEREAIRKEIETLKAAQVRETFKGFLFMYFIPDVIMGALILSPWIGNEDTEGAIIMAWITFIFILVIPVFWGFIILRAINFPHGLYDFTEIDEKYEAMYPWYHEEMMIKRKGKPLKKRKKLSLSEILFP